MAGENMTQQEREYGWHDANTAQTKRERDGHGELNNVVNIGTRALNARTNANARTLTAAKFDADLIVLSHLRWDFVYQRPQHLLSRCAKQHRVFFLEEPLAADGPAYLDESEP